jgi:hypothetical protein
VSDSTLAAQQCWEKKSKWMWKAKHSYVQLVLPPFHTCIRTYGISHDLTKWTKTVPSRYFRSTSPWGWGNEPSDHFFFLEHELERAEDRRLSADWIRCPLNGLPLVNDDREIRISRGRDIRSDSTAQQVTPIGIPVQPPIRSKSVLPSGPVSTTRQRSQTQATKLVGGIFMVYMPDHRKNRAFQTLDSIARTDRSSHRIMREGAGGRRRGRGAYSGWAREEHEAPRGSPPPPRGRAGDDAATWREPRRRREGHRSGCCCCGGCGTRNFHGRREEENERQGLGWCGQPAHQSIRWWWISCVLREAKTIWWLRA